MSASEKLRALEDSRRTPTAEAELFDALPQIRALVEAAEFSLPVLQEYSIDADELGAQVPASQLHEAHEVTYAALSALDEALPDASPFPKPRMEELR